MNLRFGLLCVLMPFYYLNAQTSLAIHFEMQSSLFYFISPSLASSSQNLMNHGAMISNISSWLFGIAVFVVGILNAVLVHPVPGIIYLLLSAAYFPPANAVLKNRFGFSIPPAVKVILGVFLFFFTLGVSDLGDMID
jgi:hypothetical protein